MSFDEILHLEMKLWKTTRSHVVVQRLFAKIWVRTFSFKIEKQKTDPCFSGVNSHSIFGAQGDLSDEKLTNLPVLQNTYLITQERYTSPDEQLSSRLIDCACCFSFRSTVDRTTFVFLTSSNSTMNWDMESNYICPTVNNNYVHLTDCVLPDNASSSSTTTNMIPAMAANPSTTKLSEEYFI